MKKIVLINLKIDNKLKQLKQIIKIKFIYFIILKDDSIPSFSK